MSEQQTISETSIEILPPSALEAITRGEVDCQISTAHKYPRSMAKFKTRAIEMACIDQSTAESTIYCRPVGEKDGKMQYAEGLSVRMAEIVGACYGNLRVGSMIVEQTERYVVVRGFAHDLESNFASTSEVKEATVTKKGFPFSEGMRAVIAKSALSKARRDATFQVVPKALCRPIEIAARGLIAGDGKSLETRRLAAVQWVQRLNIDDDRVWKALGVAGSEDLTGEDLMTLTGIRGAIRDGDATIDDSFPVIIPQGRVGAPKESVTARVQREKAAKAPAEPVDTSAPAEPNIRTVTEKYPDFQHQNSEPTDGPNDAKNRNEIRKRIGGMNIGPVRFVSTLVEMGMLTEKCPFEAVPSEVLQSALDGWEHVAAKLPPQ